jgi:hypothetical protein
LVDKSLIQQKKIEGNYMKNTNHTNIASLFLILVVPSIALATTPVNLPSVYVGMNAGLKHNGFATGYGDNIFKNKQPTANIFVGLEIFPKLNLEASVETTMKRKHEAILSGTDMYLGESMDGETSAVKGDLKMSSIGLDLIYKLNPLCCEKFNLLLGAGVKILKADLKTYRSDKPNNYVKLKEGSIKTICKLTGGYEYMFTNNYGMRGLISWENSSALKPIGTSKSGGRFHAKLKNSTNYTLGVLYKF